MSNEVKEFVPAKTSRVKTLYSHGHTGAYGFNPAEHQHAGEHHNRPVVTAQNPKLAVNKPNRANLNSTRDCNWWTC